MVEDTKQSQLEAAVEVFDEIAVRVGDLDVDRF